MGFGIDIERKVGAYFVVGVLGGPLLMVLLATAEEARNAVHTAFEY